MRTALVLLLLLAMVAVPGSFVPQEGVDRAAVSRWKMMHPDLAPTFERLGLFAVYRSPWFSAVYVLLMVSLVGCILPRLNVYWRAATAPPPRAPRHLTRLARSRTGTAAADPVDVARVAHATLRRRGFRVRTEVADDGSVTVAAQRGYLREAGNLLFHLSLVVILVAFALGNLLGFRGSVNLVAGQTFTNARQAYDDFSPGAFFSDDRLEPFNVTLQNFEADFMTSGPTLGQPTSFRADVSYSAAGGDAGDQTIEVNKPLRVGSTNVFLVGNGYAPVITVRDGKGRTVFSGPTVFVPQDTSYASWGVLKVPDANPSQLAFEGQFLPTYGFTPQSGAISRFPDAVDPALSLSAFTGDLGLGAGVPQSVFALDKSALTRVTDSSGAPLTLTIPLGTTRKLPDGLGTVTFDGLRRWTRLQISSTPAEEVALGGVLAGLAGLLASLFVRPRRMWIRAHRSGGGSYIEVGGIDRVEGRGLDGALTELLDVSRKART